MDRQQIFDVIDVERQYQDNKWGGEAHDKKHSPYCWASFITVYVARMVIWPWSGVRFRESAIKIAALAVAAIEAYDKDFVQGPDC